MSSCFKSGLKSVAQFHNVQQRVSHYTVLQECPTKVPHKSAFHRVLQDREGLKKMQECRARVSAKTGAGTLFFNVMENNEGGCMSPGI